MPKHKAEYRQLWCPHCHRQLLAGGRVVLDTRPMPEDLTVKRVELQCNLPDCSKEFEMVMLSMDAYLATKHRLRDLEQRVEQRAREIANEMIKGNRIF